MKIKRGSTSVRRLIFIADSSSTTGAGLASLVYNTSSLVAYYFAGDLSNEVQITLATATLGTFTSGGFIAVDNTNMPGWYEIGIPNAALDGGNEVCIQLRGATNMVPVNIHIELDAFDYQTATQPVNVTQFGGSNLTSAAGIPEVKVQSIANNAITAASIADNAIDTATFAAGATLPRVTLVDTCSVNTDMRGTDNAALAATALSTAVWTATIAGRIDVTLSTLATAANQTKTLDRLGYLMAQEIGACADAGTSAETYAITIDTTTYTIDHTGLDATGNRGTATLTKS